MDSRVQRFAGPRVKDKIYLCTSINICKILLDARSVTIFLPTLIKPCSRQKSCLLRRLRTQASFYITVFPTCFPLKKLRLRLQYMLQFCKMKNIHKTQNPYKLLPYKGFKWRGQRGSNSRPPA